MQLNKYKNQKIDIEKTLQKNKELNIVEIILYDIGNNVNFPLDFTKQADCNLRDLLKI